jgi:GT2 family glycosyltransferase
VVVVDDGSTDGSVLMTKTEFPWVKLVLNKENLGFAKSSNRGIAYALKHGAEHVLLLNNDVEMVENQTISKMIRIFESDNEIGILGCKLLFPNGTINYAGGFVNIICVGHYGYEEPDKGQYENVRPVDYVMGAALMIRSKVIRKIGLLDEGFSPLYFEETDWCMRARFGGYKVMYTPNPRMIHRCNFTTRTLRKNDVDFFIKKNWIRFWLLNFSLKDILKRVFYYEPREIVVSYVVEPDSTKWLGQRIRNNAASNLIMVAKAWIINIQNLGDTVAKRIERFSR